MGGGASRRGVAGRTMGRGRSRPARARRQPRRFRRRRALARAAALADRVLFSRDSGKIGRAHVSTPVTNAHLVCRLLLEKQKNITYLQPLITTTSPITATPPRQD